jgi:hypothetical protein
MKGKSALIPICVLVAIVLLPFGYVSYLKHRAQGLCDAIKVGSVMNIKKLRDTSTVEFNKLKDLSKSYGSRSYGIVSNYVLLNFNLSFIGYRCVVKTEHDVVSDKKVCFVEDDDQCFDFNL